MTPHASTKSTLRNGSAFARCVGAAAFGAMLLVAPLVQAATSHPDLTGFWEVRDDSKPEGERPSLQPDVAAANKAAGAARAAQFAKGILYPPGAALCTHRGIFGNFGDSAPTHILQTPREIAMFWESTGTARHIYMDGRPWPDPKTWQASTTGYSLGHWEGNTLVVETRGFDPRHGQPEGGGRTLKTRLLERYNLVDGGKKLAITFTLTDPAIWTKPYTYTWTYYRDPPDTYAGELVCDASDPKQARSVVPPPQD
jgi:hypothetical protein